jgi:hypothetical protein
VPVALNIIYCDDLEDLSEEILVSSWWSLVTRAEEQAKIIQYVDDLEISCCCPVQV